MKEYINKKLVAKFKDRNHFKRDELYDFYRSFEPNLNEGTFGWRIYDLKQNNVIKSIGQGLYAISYKPKYTPAISKKLLKLDKLIQEKYVNAKYSIWETAWLNEFTIHQSAINYIILDIEKFAAESAYYYLKDKKYANVFLNPTENIINQYISEEKEVIVVKNLLHRAPVHKVRKTRVPLLEKIKVDIFYDKHIFFFYQGEEMFNVFDKAMRNYSINFTKLFAYAKRRGQGKNIKGYITANFPDLIRELTE